MSNPYRAVPIAPHFYAIEENGVRMFLLEGGDEAVLIDTGFGSGDLKAFLPTVTDLPVRRVICTHADMDHLGCNHQFEDIRMHPAELDRYAAPGKYDLSCVRPLWEGEVIAVGDYRLEVVLIPGHTPGSIALLEREKRFLISGDSVQDGAIFMFGPGRNFPAYVYSMEKLMAMADCFDTVYPSHNSLTVTPDILPKLRQGALDIMAGRLTGESREMHGHTVTYYDCGCAAFLGK